MSLQLLLLLTLLTLEPFSGHVVAIVDGDTITVLNQHLQTVRIRVEGIDCPEGGQPYSQEALNFTAALVFDKTVRIRPKEYDDYGRLVGRVSLRGEDLSLGLLNAGLAWHFRRFDSDPELAAAEEKARTTRTGLFTDANPTPPWQWRSQHRGDRDPVRLEPNYTLYRGNVESRTYHSPRCQHYTCRNCTRVFPSRSAADRAGYRAHSGRGGCVE